MPTPHVSATRVPGAVTWGRGETCRGKLGPETLERFGYRSDACRAIHMAQRPDGPKSSPDTTGRPSGLNGSIDSVEIRFPLTPPLTRHGRPVLNSARGDQHQLFFVGLRLIPEPVSFESCVYRK